MCNKRSDCGAAADAQKAPAKAEGKTYSSEKYLSFEMWLTVPQSDIWI